MFNDGTISDGMFNDGTISDGMFFDGIIHDEAFACICDSKFGRHFSEDKNHWNYHFINVTIAKCMPLHVLWVIEECKNVHGNAKMINFLFLTSFCNG